MMYGKKKEIYLAEHVFGMTSDYRAYEQLNNQQADWNAVDMHGLDLTGSAFFAKLSKPLHTHFLYRIIRLLFSDGQAWGLSPV